MTCREAAAAEVSRVQKLLSTGRAALHVHRSGQPVPCSRCVDILGALGVGGEPSHLIRGSWATARHPMPELGSGLSVRILLERDLALHRTRHLHPGLGWVSLQTAPVSHS